MRLETVESWNEAVKCSGFVLLSEIKIEVCNFSVRLLLPAVSQWNSQGTNFVHYPAPCEGPWSRIIFRIIQVASPTALFRLPSSCYSILIIFVSSSWPDGMPSNNDRSYTCNVRTGVRVDRQFLNLTVYMFRIFQERRYN